MTHHTRIPTSVEDLRARWNELHDLDRAESVKMINKSGISIRALAKELGSRSDTTLRSLFIAAKAPLPDRMLARQGKISTRQLVKRLKMAAEAHQENILEETRRLLSQGEITGNLPRTVAPKGVPLSTIIEQTRPTEARWEQALELYFFVQWLNGSVNGHLRQYKTDPSRTPQSPERYLEQGFKSVFRTGKDDFPQGKPNA
jgi:lambda repressor-like predicted transcriptional regulator